MMCQGCQQPILEGEARYTGGEEADPPKYWHWECHDNFVQDLRERMRRLPETERRVQNALARLRRTLA